MKRVDPFRTEDALIIRMFAKKHINHRVRKMFLWRHWLSDSYWDYYCKDCREEFTVQRPGIDA